MKLNSIIEGDSLDVLKRMQDNYVDIVVTSPPYNAGHDYDNYDDNKEDFEYLKIMENIFTEIYRVLKRGGRICLNVPFAIKNKKTKDVEFLSHKMSSLLEKIGFKCLELITWHKGNNLNHFQGNNTAWGSWKSPSCPSFRPLGEAVMVMYKEDKKHVGKAENIDITGEEFKSWTKNIWYFDQDDVRYDNVMCISNDANKKDHPAPYPEELVYRLLKMYSYKDDIVLDPFNGTGTTTKVAHQLNRKFIGIDLSKKYCDIAYERIGEEAFRISYLNETSGLVNPSKVESTINEFFPYKESFNPHITDYLIDRYELKKYDTLMEPFLGTGSSCLSPKVKKCYGYDTNPLAIEISLAKLIKLDDKKIDSIVKSINDFGAENIKKYQFPDWDSYSKYVTQSKFDIVMSFIEHFSSLDADAFRFCKYVVISNLDKIFDYKRDGNGIKYRKSKISNEETMKYLKTLLKDAVHSKQHLDSKGSKEIYFNQTSCVDIEEKYLSNIIVTSPPYANMFDYFEVYKIELWTSGLVKNTSEWKKMKKSALRSNKNAKLNSQDVIANKTLSNTTDKLKTIGTYASTVNMINNYFYDMKNVMKEMYDHLDKDGYCFIVIGNSFYNAEPVIADEIFVEEAKKIGFKSVDMIVSRKLSTSSQQMKLISDESRQYLRESIVVLKKEVA